MVDGNGVAIVTTEGLSAINTLATPSMGCVLLIARFVEVAVYTILPTLHNLLFEGASASVACLYVGWWWPSNPNCVGLTRHSSSGG